MKKLFGLVIVFALSMICAFAIAACKKNDESGLSDADAAKDVITNVKAMYLTNPAETAADYTVFGQMKDSAGTYHDIIWTVSSDFANYGDYISVGEMNETNKLVTISITKATEVIEYKLTASVTVGDATESFSFNRTVPAGKDRGEAEMTNATISFADSDNCTSNSKTQQVWEENGVTLTNDKANSVTDIAVYNPIRLYKGSNVKIEFPGMINLVFHSNEIVGTSDYPANLLQSLQAAFPDAEITTSEDGTDVTIELAVPLDVLEFAAAGQIRLKSIEIEAYVGGATDEQKVEAAKSLLSLSETNFVTVGEYDLPSTQNGATITWAVKVGADYASIKDGKLSVDAMPAEETEVTLTATISCGDANDTKDVTVTLVPLGLVNDGTAEHPYTPSEAIKVTNLLAANETSSTVVYIQGYVISGGTYNSTYGSFDNLYIADTYSADKTTSDPDALMIYSYKPDGTLVTTAGFNPGDLVTFTGKLQNYKGNTPELTSGTCIAVKSVSEGMTDAEKVAFVKEGLALSKTEYTSVGEVNLPTSNVPDVTVSWSVKEASDYVSITEGKLSIASLPETEATITLVAAIACGDVDDTKEITITLKLIVINTDHEGTEEDPFTVADALTVLNTLDGDAKEYYKVDGEVAVVYIKGTVVDAGTYDTNYKNYNKVYIVDEGSEDKLLVYRIVLDDTYLKGEGDLQVGDVITVKGVLQNYGGTLEVNYYGTTSITVVNLERAADTRDDDQKIADAKEALTLSRTEFLVAGEEFVLPTTNIEGVEITWASNNTELVTVADGKLTVVKTPESKTEVKITATISCGTAEADVKEFTITVETPAPVATGVFKFMLTQVNLEKDLYFTGTLNSSSFGVTTEDIAAAADVTVAAAEGGHTLKVGEKYLELASVVSGTKTSIKLALVDEATGVWVYDYYLKVFTWTIGSTAYYLGTYGTFNTISASSTTYISGNNAANVGVSQFVARFVPDSRTDAEKIAGVKTALENYSLKTTFIGADVDEEVTLPVSTVYGVDVVWSIAENDYVTVVDGVMKIVSVPAVGSEAVTLKLLATISSGDEDDTYEIELILTNALQLDHEGTETDPLSVADVQKISALLETGDYYTVDGVVTKVYIKGYVTVPGTTATYYGNVYIADSKEAEKADSLWIYSANATAAIPAQTLLVGDEIVFCGYIQNYKGDIEVCSYKNPETNVTDYATIVSLTYVEMTDQAKVDMAVANVTVPATLNETVDFPVIAASVAGRLNGVVLSFASDNSAITVENNQLVVTRGSENVTGDVTVTATIGEGEGAVTAEKTVTVTVEKEADPNERTTSFSFATADQRESQDANSQVWKNNESGLTLTNNKSSSTTNVSGDVNPVKLYAKSSFTLEIDGKITKIVFNCNTTSYATALQNSIGTVEGVTVVVDSKTVTVTFDEATTSFTVASLTAQVRLDSLTVTYLLVESDGDVDTDVDNGDENVDDTVDEGENA